MKRILTILALIVSVLTGIRAQEKVDVAELQTLNLPVVTIETVDGETPTFDKVYPPEGAMGAGITNATKVPGRVTVTRLGETLYDSGEYIKNTSGMTVKVRGNTSAWSEKHPYKIKLQKKADMLCRGNDSKFKDKNWVLLNSGYSIKTMAATKMCQLSNIQWTPSSQYVNLVFNNEYQGVYILIESVERNENCRLNVSETEGYIVEMDPYWWNENTYFDTNKTSMAKKYTFKYPDADEVTPEQTEYIQSYIKDAEDAIDNGIYENYIDIPSFATWILLHDMLGTYDSGGSNIFLTKKDYQSKLEMGNLWDFDTVWSMKNNWARVHYDFFYFDDLFKNKNRTFVNEYIKQWNSIKNTIFDEVIAYMEKYASSDEGNALQISLDLEDIRWKDESASIADQVSDMRKYLTERKQWLDNAINGLDDGTGITPMQVEDKPYNTVYNIAGQKVSKQAKGILISGNKKKIVR